MAKRIVNAHVEFANVNWRRAIVLICFLLGQITWALDWRPMEIEELTARADIVVLARVTGLQCRRDDAGRIYTEVSLSVEEKWKGTAVGSSLLVVHSGGKVGGERVAVSGQVEYRTGEEVVAFLVRNPNKQWVTVGLAQGKLDVVFDDRTRQSLVRRILPVTVPTADAAIPGAVDSGLILLDNLKRRVQSAPQ